MSLTPDFVTKFPPSSLVLPVILDTGCNTGFEIDEKHLVLWSGTDISLYDCIARHDRSDGRRYATRKANIWLHLEAYSGPRFVGPRMPFQLMRTDEIAVMNRPSPRAKPYPRFPLLGLPALMDLQVMVDGTSSQFTIYES